MYVCMCIYIYIYAYICIYVYIYMYRERERERERSSFSTRSEVRYVFAWAPHHPPTQLTEERASAETDRHFRRANGQTAKGRGSSAGQVGEGHCLVVAAWLPGCPTATLFSEGGMIRFIELKFLNWSCSSLCSYCN